MGDDISNEELVNKITLKIILVVILLILIFVIMPEVPKEQTYHMNHSDEPVMSEVDKDTTNDTHTTKPLIDTTSGTGIGQELGGGVYMDVLSGEIATY